MKNTRPKIRILFLNVLIFLLTTIHPDALCQEQEGKHQLIMYMTAPTMTTIRDGKSDDLDIGNKAWMAEIGICTKLYHLIGISGALGYGSIKDYNTFTQSTTWGDLESSFTTLSYDFKAGIWTPELGLIKDRKLNVSAGTSIGVEGFSGRREIVNCEDCEVEKYKFKGGFFVEPEINFFFCQNLIGVGTSYRYFFGDNDLISSWTLLKIMVRFDLLNR